MSKVNAVNKPIERFSPPQREYNEVSIIDCNDSFTHNLVQSFLKLGAPVRVFNSHQVELNEVREQLGHYAVLSPGPGTPDEAGILKPIIPYLVEKVPVLGVCLGMQAINEWLGGKTIRAPIPFHGKTSNIYHDQTGIFNGIPSPTRVARYHSLMIEPADEVRVQSSINNTIMAFKLSNTVAGIQFHPESFLTPQGLIMLNNFLEIYI